MAAFLPYTSCFSSIQNRTEDSVILSGLSIDLWYTDPMEMTKLPCGSGDHNKVKSTDVVEIAMAWLVPRNLSPLLTLAHKTLRQIVQFPYVEGLRRFKDSFGLYL